MATEAATSVEEVESRVSEDAPESSDKKTAATNDNSSSEKKKKLSIPFLNRSGTRKPYCEFKMRRACPFICQLNMRAFMRFSVLVYTLSDQSVIESITWICTYE